MKNAILLFTILISVVSCQSDNDCMGVKEIEITLPNGDFLTIPSCWEHEILQGIDTSIGEITYEPKGIEIRYDIGILAGSAVDESSDTKIIEESKNEVFWYEAFERPYEGNEDCCVYFTFPNRGPANFWTANDKNFNQVLEVMKTYESN